MEPPDADMIVAAIVRGVHRSPPWLPAAAAIRDESGDLFH